MSERLEVAELLRRLSIGATSRGEWLTAKCPSPEHADKNPSWRINLGTGKHRCFSCGFHGGPVRLVMVALDMTPKQAAEWIASEELAAPQSLEVELTFIAPPRSGGFRLPSGVIIAPLAAWPGPARDYASSRGLTAAQVERWGLGYAVDGRLAGRVVFPVRDSRGVLLSYTGRSFTGARKKYIMPDLAERADPGAVFGEQWWDGQHDCVVVTEGALDALAVERVTGLPVAAVYGSNLEPGQIARLSRPIHHGIVVAVDADEAGDRVAQAIVDALARWTRVVRWRPPPGDDCASLALKSPALVHAGIHGAWTSA